MDKDRCSLKRIKQNSNFNSQNKMKKGFLFIAINISIVAVFAQGTTDSTKKKEISVGVGFGFLPQTPYTYASVKVLKENNLMSYSICFTSPNPKTENVGGVFHSFADSNSVEMIQKNTSWLLADIAYNKVSSPKSDFTFFYGGGAVVGMEGRQTTSTFYMLKEKIKENETYELNESQVVNDDEIQRSPIFGVNQNLGVMFFPNRRIQFRIEEKAILVFGSKVNENNFPAFSASLSMGLQYTFGRKRIGG